ncbi:hypothetical protein DFH07DRAFT_831208, partial [Mycena maculata]
NHPRLVPLLQPSLNRPQFACAHTAPPVALPHKSWSLLAAAVYSRAPLPTPQKYILPPSRRRMRCSWPRFGPFFTSLLPGPPRYRRGFPHQPVFLSTTDFVRTPLPVSIHTCIFHYCAWAPSLASPPFLPIAPPTAGLVAVSTTHFSTHSVYCS